MFPPISPLDTRGIVPNTCQQSNRQFGSQLMKLYWPIDRASSPGIRDAVPYDRAEQ
jgi:hypothetical protein